MASDVWCFNAMAHKTVASLVMRFLYRGAGLMVWACLAWTCCINPSIMPAATPLKLSGAIGGAVTNGIGSPQMGATVIVYNRHGRQFEDGRADEGARFAITGRFPDLDSVKVT